ncbi:sterol-sensing domain of SREBP cleavage-activation-domain-containing protein [Infundibulicybe gibba]|nr:sterol-sensing domain of SREBP cleavage-activation-domain-containing protein [Infundibulicybe gibba]
MLLQNAPRILTWARTHGQRFFLRFGLHCATHQIRVILISCIVITSLFYPALAIYSSSHPKSLSIIDTFTSSSSTSGPHTHKDLVNLWSGHDALRVHEDAVSRAKCSFGRALRVERLLIQSPRVDDDGALNLRILQSTLALEQRIEELISSGEIPCLKRPNGRCFVLSPLSFWSHKEEALLSDTNIVDTLSLYKNITIDGIPITPPMVLAGRGSIEHHVSGSQFDFATFLALTYFFPDSECLGASEHQLWLQAVHQAASGSPDLIVEPQEPTQEPTLVALEYDPNLSEMNGWSVMSIFLYSAYIGFFAYVTWTMRRMDRVHSRIGITFTALVEITVSTITSLSVCALVGFRITMVPWELLPILIVFVGAENMFNLVDAVGKTSVTLSVKQRIAEGLSRAGTSNTLKVVSYNSILGITAVFSIGAIRQFCIFAIVVLVAHWFLAHTFFMAVLSIDIQRLELDELLRHDPSLTPALHKPVKDLGADQKPATKSGWKKLVVMTQRYLKGRATTNISLLMQNLHSASLGAVSRSNSEFAEQKLEHKSAAWHIWKSFNPNREPLLHIQSEVPTIVTLRPSSDNYLNGQKSRPRFSMRTFRLVYWLLKIMVLPIAVTTSILWGLLLYLLKNTELLEAQRNRAEADTPLEGETSLEGGVSFSTLPRAFESDVELLAASKDGQIIVSVGLHNEIRVWRADATTSTPVDVLGCCRVASGSNTSPTITTLAVDDGGDNGMVAPWSILATYESGMVARWQLGDKPILTRFPPPQPSSVVTSSLVCFPGEGSAVVFFMDDGTVEFQNSPPFIHSGLQLRAGHPLDTVSKIHACRADLGGETRAIIAVATSAGSVSLWDGGTGECISILDDSYGNINRLRVTPVQCETCRFCGQLPMESILVAFSVDHITRRCSCVQNQPRQSPSREGYIHRSRTNSTTSAMGILRRTFPGFAHGFHSRRASDKDSTRRSSDTLTVPLGSEDSDRSVDNNSSIPDMACERGGWDVIDRQLVGPQTFDTTTTTSSYGLTPATLERWELWTFDPSFTRIKSALLAELAKSSSSASVPASPSEPIPRLPFTRVSPLLIVPKLMLAGFGNTVGIFTFS